MIAPVVPYPAALVKAGKTRALVISDLHIGWEVALSEKGIHVPTQTPKLLQRLKAIIGEYNPERLLIVGDVKHTIAMAELSEWQDVPWFFKELKESVKEIEIILGNHDGNLEPLLPENIKLLPSAGTIIGDVGLFHGHRWPPPELLNCKVLVMGHIHPVIALRDPAGFRITRQVWVKAKCDAARLAEALLQRQGIKFEGSIRGSLAKRGIKPKISQIFIMPSFNDFLGGKPLNDEVAYSGESEEALGPILRSGAVDMGNAEIYLLDGTFLGNLKQLKTTFSI